MILFEWTGENREGALTDWRDGLERRDQQKLDAKTLMLETADRFQSLPGFVVGPIRVGGRPYQGIYKLQIGKKLSLRPLLCRGPQDGVRELTFLVGAREQDSAFDPPGAPDLAEKRRRDLLTKKASRREYETPPKRTIH